MRNSNSIRLPSQFWEKWERNLRITKDATAACSEHPGILERHRYNAQYVIYLYVYNCVEYIYVCIE